MVVPRVLRVFVLAVFNPEIEQKAALNCCEYNDIDHEIGQYIHAGATGSAFGCYNDSSNHLAYRKVSGSSPLWGVLPTRWTQFLFVFFLLHLGHIPTLPCSGVMLLPARMVSYFFISGNVTSFDIYQLTEVHKTWEDLRAFKYWSVSVFIDFPLNPFITWGIPDCE